MTNMPSSCLCAQVAIGVIEHGRGSARIARIGVENRIEHGADNGRGRAVAGCVGDQHRENLLPLAGAGQPGVHLVQVVHVAARRVEGFVTRGDRQTGNLGQGLRQQVR